MDRPPQKIRISLQVAKEFNACEAMASLPNFSSQTNYFIWKTCVSAY